MHRGAKRDDWMMRNDRRFFRWLFLGCLFSAALSLFGVTGEAAESQASYWVSMPKLHASTDERIVAFQIQVTAGAFVNILNLPIEWYLDIKNSSGWQSEMKGNITVGAASLDPDELTKLRFLVQKREIGDLKFNLSGDVSFTKDDEHFRPVHLKMSDFVVTPMRSH